MQRDIYQDVTNRIIVALEQGAMPWLRPWREGVGCETDIQIPRNAVSGRGYSGVNVFLLWATADTNGYSSNRWLTFKQAKESGGTVRAGEKGTMIVYFRKLSKTEARPDGTTKESTFGMLRCYFVFNVEQCDNLPAKLTAGKPLPPAPELDSMFKAFVGATQAKIGHGGDRAYYSPFPDSVTMPHVQAFKSLDHYKATLLHELTHWTGHESRLARQFGKRFGNEAYAFEELVAEIGAAFLCAYLGVTAELRHADYLASWLKVLKADNRAIFTAASQASKAADFLRAFSETAESEDDESEAAQAA